MARVLCLLFSTFILSAGQSLAQSGTAIEIAPGITSYSGPGGSTLGVEVFPGVTHFSGAVNGTAVEVYPGIRHYNFNSVENYEPIRVPSRPVEPAFSGPDPIERALRYKGAEPKDQWIKDLAR